MNHSFVFNITLRFLTLFLFTSLMIQGVCEKPAKPSVFVISTEFQIGKIKHILEKAPKGIYISVGSERSFRGASMALDVSHVYMLDVSPEILRYNKINSELLKAPNREVYKVLRWEGSFADWKKLKLSLKAEDFDWWKDHVRDLDKMEYSLPESLNKCQTALYLARFQNLREKLRAFYQAWKTKEAPLLPLKDFIESTTMNQLQELSKKHDIPLQILPEEWKWWIEIGKTKDKHCLTILMDNPEQVIDLSQIVDYKTGNYLFDDTLYERLHQLAIQGKITSIQVDLSDESQLENLLTLLKKDKESIGVLDLDNLYFKDYIGQIKYRKIVEKFLPLGQDTSLLLVMSNTKDYACGQFQTYIGFTFENIRHWPPFFYMQSFFDTLPKDLVELIQGRLYEKKEAPPYRYLLGD